MTMKRFLPKTLLSCTAAMALSVPAGAQVSTVPAAAASSNFSAATKHLELGGLFYGFMDVDGDLTKFGNIGDRFLDIARKQKGGPEIPKGLKAIKILDALGLTSVKALGASTSSLGGGMYHNRAIVYAPGGQVGLFKLFGGKAAPFVAPILAPAGSDIAAETDLNLSALLEISENVLKSIGDERLMQQYQGSLGFPVPVVEMTVGELISKLDTKITVFGQLVDGKSFPIPNSPVEMPAFKLVIGLDNIDFLFPPLLEMVKQAGDKVKVVKGDGFELIQSAQPLPGDFSFFQPVVYHDLKTRRILISSHLDYLRSALTGAKPLSGDPAYVKAVGNLPKEGNSLSYITPKVASTIMALVKSAMKQAQGSGAPPEELIKEIMGAMDDISPLPTSPVAAVRANVPDGMLFASNDPSTMKGALVTVAVVPAAFIAGGIAGFNNAMPGLRAKQAEAAEISEALPDAPKTEPKTEAAGASAKAIKNNLQQIAYSAQTYFLDNPKAKEVTYEKLISSELLFKLDAVSGESYKGLIIKRAGGSLSVKNTDGESITQTYQPVTD